MFPSDDEEIKGKWKKRSERCKHCALAVATCKAEPKIFAPPKTPFPGARDGQNLISWRWSSLPLPINPVWWRSMHAISSYRGNRPTNKHNHKQTGPITTHCAAKLSTQCKYKRQTGEKGKRLQHKQHFTIWMYNTVISGSIIPCQFNKLMKFSHNDRQNIRKEACIISGRYH